MPESSGPKSRKRISRSEISLSPKRQKTSAEKSEHLATKTQPIHPRKKPSGKENISEEITAKSIKKEEITKNSLVNETVTVTQVKAVRRRKTKEEKEAEQMPLAERAIGCKILAGAHVSAAGGAQNAVKNSVRIGGNAFALFLKSQRKWAFAPLSDDHRTQFIQGCNHHHYGSSKDDIAPIVPHGSYLVNLAHTEKSRATQAYETFLDDLVRCNQMGIRLYNFHPGNAIGADSRTDALKQLAKQLNKSHQEKLSGNVITLLETMAATGGNTIGSTFEELAAIIDLVDDKERVGICLDTCHVFAAGYDLRTPEAFSDTMDKFDSVIGLKYLKAFHVNDSKAPLGSGRDLHANIGTGFLGLSAFWNLVNDSRLWGLPFILETPISRKNDEGKSVEDESIWAREIKLLENLVGMDRDSDEFKKLETELAMEGKVERDRIQSQVDRRKNGKKKKKSKETDSDSDDESD